MSARLDERARQAVRGVRAAVPPPPPFEAPRPGHPAWAAASGALAAMVLLVAVWLLRPPVEVDPAVTTTTTSPSTTVVGPSTTLPVPSTTVPVPSTTAPPPTAGTSRGSTGSESVVADTTPPPIVIVSPVEGAVLEEKVVTFEGTTEPGARVVAGPYEADVDESGAWRIVLVLAPGPNTARFTAVDDAGNESTASVTVRFEKPAEVAGFDAHFTWGECSATPPYDEYYGRGEPFSKVTVSSEYGGGTTKVGGDGAWYLKVEFPKAPLGTTFPVVVEDSLGRRAVFEFTAVG